MKILCWIFLCFSLLSCQAVQKEPAASDLFDADACRLPQRFTSLPLSCGNDKCEGLLFENGETCPQDCLDAKTRVAAYYAQSQVCSEPTVVHSPKNIESLQQLVRDIRSRGKKVRVIATRHSSSDLICPSQAEVVSMEQINKIIGMESYGDKETVHFEGNVRFWDLVTYLDQQGYALDQRIPGFGGISVGGFIATGAHGSDANHSATISSSIVSLEILNDRGELKLYDAKKSSADEWRALRAHLGALGIVTKIRLEVRPRYNMAMKIIEHNDGILFSGGGKFLDAVRSCPFVFLHYVRGKKKVYLTCGAESAEEQTHPDLENALFKPPVGGAFAKIAVSLFQQAACSRNSARLLEGLIHDVRGAKPWIQWVDEKGEAQHRKAGVGSWHRTMQTIFDPSVQPKFSQVDWEVAVPFRNFESVMRELKSFMDDQDVLIPSIGVIMRLDRANRDSLLAPSASDTYFKEGELLFHIEMPIYTPFGFSVSEFEARKRPYREFFLSLIDRYEARPHFGKNDTELLTSPITLRRLGESIGHFRGVQERLDPDGAFSNEFLQKVGLAKP